MNTTSTPSSTSMIVGYYDRVTLRPLNELQALHEPDLVIQVVPGHEADVDAGRISADAPVGRAVLRRCAGETIAIQAQGRSIPMLILSVEKHSGSA